ncbi:MAG: hypothetical protein ACXVFN_14585 [Solirubrobacteraceae bacterium]
MSAADALAWEEQNRTRAAISAFVAAGLTIIGGIISGLALRGVPKAEDRAQTIIDTLGRAATGTENPPGRLSAQTLYLGSHAALPILGSVLFAIGSLALFGALAFLFRATRARRPATSQAILIVLAAGTVAFAVGRAVFDIARYVGASGFHNSVDQSNSAAADALGGSTSLAGQLIWQLGALALAVAFLIIALNAMRVGLLTRFMGVLGMIVGATFVLPLDQQGIIRVFWLAALGVLLLGRWPRGMPPAWSTGEAMPWPSQQQIREQREAQRAEGQRAEPVAPAPVPRAPEASATGASRRKKRKRRS